MNVRRREQDTCTCKSYAFPHRLAGGSCHAKEPGPYCGDCGCAAQPTEQDFGIGAYEAWGRTGVDKDVRVVSTCCEAPLFEDASLTINYEHHDEDFER